MPIRRSLWLLALAGCAALGPTSSDDHLGGRYQYRYALTKPATSGMTWADDRISIQFQIGEKAVQFTLQNKTDEAVKIVWDEAAIVQFGKSLRVMHEGVRFSDRGGPQLPTTVPPGASVSDILLPTENIYWREGYYSRYGSTPGGWEQHDLFTTRDLKNQKFREDILASKGRKFSVHLPLLIKGKTQAYAFEFTITDVIGVVPGT